MAGIGKAKIARAREKHFLVRKKTQFEECASRVCMDVVACKLVVRPEVGKPGVPFNVAEPGALRPESRGRPSILFAV